jgi:two-component system cell cycle sensor histidine kinase/response regulator CckA
LSLFWETLPWLLTVAGGVAFTVAWRRHRSSQAARRRSETALASAGLTITRIRQAVEGASDAIGIGDFEGTSFYHNQAHIKMFGYSVEELNAVPGEGVLFADQGIGGEILASIRAGRSWTGETDIVAKDGRRIPALVRADIIRDDHGKPVGIFGVFTDITEERRRAEESARGNTLESLGLMAGSIAHDFRNILATILANVSLVQLEDTLSETVKTRLDGIEKAVWRAKDVTEQLTTFAKGGTPTKKRVRFAPLLREAAGLAVHHASVELRCSLEEGLWDLEADEVQLLQVFNNLAVNAVQAMPGGGVLTITAQNEVPPPELADIPGIPRCVAVTVADTGVGIPPENIARIFEPFFTTKPTGTGLGLATCYAVIRSHGGKLRVDSAPGQGTTFHIRLPALGEDAQPVPANVVSKSA